MDYIMCVFLGLLIAAGLCQLPGGIANPETHYKQNVCTYLNGEWINNSDGPNFCLIDGRRVDIKEKK